MPKQNNVIIQTHTHAHKIEQKEMTEEQTAYLKRLVAIVELTIFFSPQESGSC